MAPVLVGLEVAPPGTKIIPGSREETKLLALLWRHGSRHARSGSPRLLQDARGRAGHLWYAATALADAFWPGALTLVLAGGEGRLPDALRGPEGGIAVRWTSHAVMAQLIEALGHPLTSTSANLPGGPTAPGAAAIGTTFATAVTSGTLLVLDGGTLGNVPPSTVVDCTRAHPRLVREGAIPKNELRRRAGSAAP